MQSSEEDTTFHMHKKKVFISNVTEEEVNGIIYVVYDIKLSLWTK